MTKLDNTDGSNLVPRNLRFSLAGLVILVACFCVWTFLGNVPVKVYGYGFFNQANSEDSRLGLSGLAFVSVYDGKLIAKGMQAYVNVSTADTEESGYMEATVQRAGLKALSQKEFLARVGSEKEAKDITSKLSGALIEIELTPKLASSKKKNKYVWTLSGTSIDITPGTLFKVEIIVANRKPIDFLLPRIGSFFEVGS